VGSELASPLSAALPFYNDLALSLERAWQLLEQGADTRGAGFHTLCVASVDAQGLPRVRTLTLREADRNARTLRFHIDQRSPKFAQISNQPAIAVSHYSAADKVELRMHGNARFHLGDELAERAWLGMRDISRFCYRSAKAPGEVIESTDEYPVPTSHSVNKHDVIARHNFGVMMFHIESLEWIYLDSRGNRRAAFSWSDGQLSANWIAP
jgi:pyridoxamine 5'-phosphate oxidase